jgi:hypothetical protein
MSDDAPQEPMTPPTGSSTAPPIGAGTAPTEWRVPMDDPRPWARGKTATELLAVTDQAVSALYNVASQPSYQPQAPVQQGPGVDDDEIIDGRRLKQIMQQAQQPQQQPDNESLAQMSLAMARQQMPDVFTAYGPEVMGHLVQLPKSMWTLDNILRVARLVKADHVDEIADQRARDLAAKQGWTVRTTGAAPGYPGGMGSPLSLESEELPADYRALLKKRGVTEAQAREFCRTNGITFESWVADAKKLKTVIGED